ncbi:MAG: hypothetical protein HY055_16310 [Magnetospirillum sp.]|nr:hypothetical protein [Magnetospirillum sp.]
MTGKSFRCIAMMSEARRLYDEGRYAECMRIIDSIRSCTTQCGEEAVCATALRIVSLQVSQFQPQPAE